MRPADARLEHRPATVAKAAQLIFHAAEDAAVATGTDRVACLFAISQIEQGTRKPGTAVQDICRITEQELRRTTAEPSIELEQKQ